jgi:Family of unknown function (DUF6523)
MAVPRTEKVANAVFEQEEALMKGVLRLFPKLKDAELEYGHNLKVCVYVIHAAALRMLLILVPSFGLLSANTEVSSDKRLVVACHMYMCSTVT